MFLASRTPQALRATLRTLKLPSDIAALHTAAIPHIPASTITQPVAKAIRSTPRTLLTRLLSTILPTAHAGGPVRTIARGVHIPATRTSAQATVHQSLSLPSRVALSPRPFGPSLGPRSPVLAPNRCVTQVGLGTARNFSSGRPIFQNIVQNVPVAGRAFCQVDLDFKLRARHQQQRLRLTEEVKPARKSALSPRKTARTEAAVVAVTANDALESNEAEFSRYFATAAAAAQSVPAEPYVTTLLIPLSPIDGGERTPLDSGIHMTYAQHSLRVAGLFTRLDRANVWERGAVCECIDSTGEGVCSVLRVSFDGWSESMLREVVGSDDRGWFAVECVPKQAPQSAPSPVFIMPMLDFSASSAVDVEPSYTSRWVHAQAGADSFDEMLSNTPESGSDIGFLDISDDGLDEWSTLSFSPMRTPVC